MKEEDLHFAHEIYDSYFDMLCKAILLDKVKIEKGRIKVESFDE